MAPRRSQRLVRRVACVIDAVGDDICTHVIQRVGTSDILSFRLASKRINDLYDDDGVWRALCERDGVLASKPSYRSWMGHYACGVRKWYSIRLDQELCGAQSTEEVKELLASGANVHSWDDLPLRQASFYCHSGLVEELLSAGADACAQNNCALKWATMGRSHVLVPTGDRVRTVKVLLAAGADIHAEQDIALRRTCEMGDVDVVDALLRAGANVHAMDDEPLSDACRKFHADVVDSLIGAGANVNAREGEFLVQTSHMGTARIVNSLLAAGARHYSEALLMACYGGNVDIVQALLTAGADVRTDPQGEALQLASLCDHESIIEVLLAAGADVHAADDAALRRATEGGAERAVRALLAAGADVYALQHSLGIAMQKRHHTVVEALLAAGAPLPHLDARYMPADTPQHWLS